jgi:hypothetical protein
MSSGIGAARGSWFAIGGEPVDWPEHGSPTDAAFPLFWTNVLVVEMGASLTAPSTARQLSRTALAEWRVPALIADAELICTELVSNAVKATKASYVG